VSDLGDAVERIEEVAPEFSALAERGATGSGKPIEAASPLPGFLDPSSADESLFFELVQKGI
jgi:hypothetical protein